MRKTEISAIILTAIFIASTGICHAGILRLMTSLPKNDFTLANLVEQYEKTHKSTSISIISITETDESEALSKKPDLYFGSNKYITNNWSYGLVSDMSSLALPETKDVLPGLLPAYSSTKKLFGVPIFGVVNVIQYNKKLFAKAGIASPRNNWTWKDDFYPICKKLSQDRNGDGRNDIFGVVGIPQSDFLSTLFSYGGTVVNADDKPVYTEPKAMAAVEYILKLHQEGLAESIDFSAVVQGKTETYPFYNGKSAMSVTAMSSYNQPEIVKALKKLGIDIDVDFTAIPRGPQGSIPVISSLAVALLPTCRNKDEALKFIKYILSVQGQTMIFNVAGGLPTTVSAFSSEAIRRKLPQIILTNYLRSRARMIIGNWIKVENTLWADILAITNGTSTMSDLIENARKPVG